MTSSQSLKEVCFNSLSLNSLSAFFQSMWFYRSPEIHRYFKLKCFNLLLYFLLPGVLVESSLISLPSFIEEKIYI